MAPAPTRTGGSLILKNTGDGGKGISAGSYDFDETNHSLSDSRISGGSLTVTTTGREVNDVSAKGIKIGWVTKNGSGDHATVTGNAGNLVIDGGNTTVNCNTREGLEVKGNLTIIGGEVHVTSASEDGINCQGDFRRQGRHPLGLHRFFRWWSGRRRPALRPL